MCKTRDYNLFTGDRWIYRCESGEYRESNFVGLLYTIFLHRLSHLIKGEGFRD